jgi:DNA polymerase-3 subunit epsilon
VAVVPVELASVVPSEMPEPNASIPFESPAMPESPMMSVVPPAALPAVYITLAWLAAGAGFFYDRHRALNDCHAGIELLARALPRSGTRGMAQLLARARAPSWRIGASGAPYDLKDALKARGYRWNGDGAGAQRAWFIDVPDHARDAEFRYLQDEIYRRVTDINCRRIDAYDRFSTRV